MKKYNIINNSLGWLCFVIAAVTYLLTLEPTASFWDCPEFISQGMKLEVGHPPGNPIWMLTARFFINFAGGDVSLAALMVNAMSALLSAGTILLLFWTVTHLVRRIMVKDDATEVSLAKMIVIFGAGICGALAYTWSDTFWFSAVEGEVYAFSSFCTALVFWLILKWEDRADDPTSDRYLILIAYVIGISIAVHLLNLLCIPAIGLVIYYRKYKDTNVKGSLIALAVSCVVVGLILYGLVPGFVEMAQYFELFFVNTCGMSYNMGTLIYAIVLVATFIWAIYELYSQRSTGKIKFSSCLAIFLSGMPFMGESYFIPVLFMIGLILYCIFTSKLPIRILNIIITGVLVIFIGYSSYALLLIRADANTPMNQNQPDNVFALSSYLNREQYGQRPLFRGATFAEIISYQEDPETGRPSVKYVPASSILRDAHGNAVTTTGRPEYAKVVKTSPDQPDQYIVKGHKTDYEEIPEFKMFFPRIYSTDGNHVRGYKDWVNYDSSKARVKTVNMYDSKEGGMVAKNIALPTFADNLSYFINYQMSHMYWRYFLWNFAGRQNDIQGNGEVTQGNWISGIPFIDNARLGDQSLLPDEYGKGNKGHNVFFMLPLLFGILGLLWQLFASKRGTEQFWVVCFLFLMTGVAIVLYLNQTPGQPRERDYAFAGSFYAFAIWIGMAVPAIWVGIKSLLNKKKSAVETEKTEDKKSLAIAVVAAVLGLIVPLQMVSQTWDDHDRSGRYAARDFGMNYLSSVDQNGIIYVNGDNDTFPLWYAQEVEGYRTDVKVVNMSYLTTDWYASQIQHPSYDAPAIDMYAKPENYLNDKLQYSYIIPRIKMASAKDALLHRYSDASYMPEYGINTINAAAVYIPVNADEVIKAGVVPEYQRNLIVDTLVVDIQRYVQGQGEPGLALNKTLTLDMIAKSAENGWNRPIYFAVTVPNSYHLGLTPYLQQTGMAYQVTPARTGVNGNHGINAEKMYDVVMNKYRWGGLDQGKDLYLDETVRRMTSTTRSTMIDLAHELYYQGAEALEADSTGTLANEYFEKSRKVLNLMEEKLPSSVMPYENYASTDIADLYIQLYEATGNEDDKNRALALAEDGLSRYTKFIPYLVGLKDWQLKSIAYSEKYVSNIAIPQFMILYQQAGGDIDKKLEELGVTIKDILSLRYRLYQVDYPNISADHFAEPMAEYYGMLQYKPSEIKKHLTEFFADKGINLSVE
ncbi:MAG: DUF2723 domain-containing protein [Muribaculaceae bacterium]|nr:DUF2723 domain-containing protein [Muribaculaceae bacterium]